MYSYKTAYVKDRLGGRWIENNVRELQLSQLFTLYKEVIFSLNHPLYEKPVALYLSTVPDTFNLKNSSETIDQFLIRIGSTSLPIELTFPSLDVQFAHFKDAVQSGFKIDAVHRQFDISVQVDKEDKTDLRLTKEGLDPFRLFRTTLVTVNGLLHRTNYVGNAIHVIDGALNGFHANKTCVGLYYLGQLGDIRIIPIKESHITGYKEQPLHERAFVTIDDSYKESLTNKSILLSIGGYLHYPEDTTFLRYNDRTFTIDFIRYPLIQRFYEMRQLLKMETFNRQFFKKRSNVDQIDIDVLYSNETIVHLLTLSQSFFIIVDTPQLFLEKEFVEFNHLPNSYISYDKPLYPLQSGLGRFYEYWTRREYDRYILNVEEGVKDNLLLETTDWKTNRSVDNSRTPYQVTDYHQAFFYKLGKSL